MKTIIKQAVADAAQYLHLEQGVGPDALEGAEPKLLVQAAKEMRLEADRGKRDAQLLWAELCDEAASLTGVPAGPVPKAPTMAMIAAAADKLVIHGPGGKMVRADVISAARTEACADAAWFLLNCDSGHDQSSLCELSPRALVEEARRRGFAPRSERIHYSHISIPRAKLEALRDARDGKDGVELCDLLAAISDVLEYL